MAFLEWGREPQSAYDRILLRYMVNIDRLRQEHQAHVVAAEIHFPDERTIVYCIIVGGWGYRVCYN